MKANLNQTHISILNQVLKDLNTDHSPIYGSSDEIILTMVLIEWHRKNIAKLVYKPTGFRAEFSDAQAYAMCSLIACTMLPEEHDAIEFGALLNLLAKRLPKSAFKRFSTFSPQVFHLKILATNEHEQ